MRDDRPYDRLGLVLQGTSWDHMLKDLILVFPVSRTLTVQLFLEDPDLLT